MNLSAHFTLEEMTNSETASRKGIDNTPSSDIVQRLTSTCQQLELVRTLLNLPMIVTSGYRSPELNAAIGGVAGSAHCEGYAVDFICPQFGSPLQICQAIKTAQIRVDQVIQEGTWVHVSFAPTYRNEYLTATFTAGGATYQGGIS